MKSKSISKSSKYLSQKGNENGSDLELLDVL
jgi:hypothetical protein